VAELVDALASGASGLTAVKVRVLSWAPFAHAHDLRKCGLVGPLPVRETDAAGNELADRCRHHSVHSVGPLPISATPVSEPGQLPDKQAVAEASVDFQPIVVREEQKLWSGLCCHQSVPAEFKRKFDRFG
jgi:hypothetical protein